MADAFTEQVRISLQKLVAEQQDPAARAKIIDTLVVIADRPTQDQVSGLDPQSSLAGMYEWEPRPTITIFRATLLAKGLPVDEVLRHEFAHRLGFRHLDEFRYACSLAKGGSMKAAQQQAGPDPLNPDCPVCRLDAYLSRAAWLMTRLADAAQQQGRIPVGLGGTIPLAAEAVRRACAILPAVAEAMPGRRGEVETVARCVQQSAAQLAGWLGPAQVAMAAQSLERCAEQAYTLAWGYFAAKKGANG